MPIEPNQIKKAVLAAVSETFEAMIFTPIAPIKDPDIASLFAASVPSETSDHDPGAAEPDSSPTPLFYQTGISLKEPKIVSFSMIFPYNLATGITKNLYGWMEENDPPEHLIQDSLAEIINTVAGKLMTILLDDRSTFALSLPNLKSINSLAMDKGDIYTYQTVDNETFALVIDGDLCSE